MPVPRGVSTAVSGQNGGVRRLNLETDPLGAGGWEGRRAKMPRSRDGSHSLLPGPRGEPGEPFLPKVGELYRVNTIIFLLGNDPAAARPAVVVTVPPDPTSRFPIQLVTRTSKSVPGIVHPADSTLGLNRDGVFADLVSVELQLWRPQNVERLGVLPDPYLSAVLRRFT